MEGSLEVKVIAVFKFVPDEVWTLAEKLNVFPSVNEVFDDGLRLMRPGNRGGPGLAPPPHPVMGNKERMVTARLRPIGRNLPMHSSPKLTVILFREHEKTLQ